MSPRSDHRDGRRVCTLLAPGVVGELELPRERGSCAASLDASIGYRDPRGLPEFRGIGLSQISAIDLGRKAARATTSIVTSFADRSEPSIEDDLIYLRRSGERWLIVEALERALPGDRRRARAGRDRPARLGVRAQRRGGEDP